MEFLKYIFSKLKKHNQYKRKEKFHNSEHKIILDIKDIRHIAQGNSAEISSSTIEFQRPTKTGKVLLKNK
jgi:hypothetical protein